ncbi:nuclear envelope integral membrane protein-like isoform X2 [Artemia franciscana]|uniref:nuclear envelope integral membrane protein-like isoform X2 n=1 Tax=Artemia franciscana TaxID=6661 RepID=UPI0032DBE053
MSLNSWFAMLLVTSFDLAHFSKGELCEPLKAGKSVDARGFQIFCYVGEEKQLSAYFASAYVQIETQSKTSDPIIYTGYSEEQVVVQRTEQQSNWLSLVLPWQKGMSVSLNPFNQSAIGIEVESEDYKVNLVLKRISVYRLSALVCGVVLFFWAPFLAGNAGFFYGTGILTGVFASILLLLYLLYKFTPLKRAGGFIGAFTLFGGLSLVVYFLNSILTNFREIAFRYSQYLFIYVVVASIISFFVCYRIGPPQNERSITVLQWTLQLFGLLMIFASSHYQEVSLTIIVIVVALHNFPSGLVRRLNVYWICKFPPAVKLLTEEQYNEQGVKETKKALNDLRKHVSSPDCDTWKLVSRLKTPLRFAEFVQEGSHLTDQEIQDYEETECLTSDESFEESDCSFSEEDI